MKKVEYKGETLEELLNNSSKEIKEKFLSTFCHIFQSEDIKEIRKQHEMIINTCKQSGELLDNPCGQKPKIK